MAHRAAMVVSFGMVVSLLVVSGCGGEAKYTVEGRVTRSDGSPVVGARVIFRSSETRVNGSGRTDEEGNYEIGTVDKGDGLPAGNYSVIISEDRGSFDNPRPPTISLKYGRPTTSGIKFTVGPGQDNDYNLVLDKK